MQSKTPEEMTIIELKAMLFDLENSKQLLIKILQKKLSEEKKV